ncbi:UNVERIFIED_CONTAM: hypothetical protein GTU68_048730 [Idotea baltica]|nr:hypothetical protein [Idotea baltica]
MGNSRTILVIEDEPSIADNILYALSTEGFSSKLCQTAAEADEYLASSSPDLILLDIGLPDESGFEFAKRIRKECDLPIIFVTARAEEVDRILGLEIGADDYVVKPFSPRELTARIKAVLRRSTRTELVSSKITKYGDFLLDEEKVYISYCGLNLELSRYEFRIMAILVKRPGRVYSREQLMQLAWEEPDMSLERTVDTHIKTIRQKIRKCSNSTKAQVAEISDEELIITHRGIGYSLKESQ